MSRPPLEVADLIRAAGATFQQSSRKWFTWLHLKILTAIVCCRTSVLGGHIDECSNCGHRAILQLVPEPALPEVSGQRARPVDRSAPPGASADPLCPRGLYAPQ
jgi:transposase-like zinc-binding protein